MIMIRIKLLEFHPTSHHEKGQNTWISGFLICTMFIENFLHATILVQD
jgi:hypothetical protein